MWNVVIKVKDIDWKIHEIVLTEDQQRSIVDIAESKDIELPYSCRSGACYSCCAEVHKGQDWIDTEKTGEQLIDVEDNECLTCIAWVDKKAFEQSDNVEIELEMLN